MRLDSHDCHRRWDQCWVRLLDGMLQLSVAGTRDYELRIPTRIRSIVINNAAGTQDGQILVRPANRLSGTRLPAQHASLDGHAHDVMVMQRLSSYNCKARFD